MGAKAGTLTAMVGCRPPSEGNWAPTDADGRATTGILYTALQAMAQRIVYLDTVGAGNAVKCINNLMNVSHLVLASECMYGLRLAGVNVGSALDAINHSSGRSLQTEVRLPQEVLSGRYQYGFDLALMLKDVRQAQAFLHAQFVDKASECKEGDEEATTETRTTIPRIANAAHTRGRLTRLLPDDLLLTEWTNRLEALLATSLEEQKEVMSSSSFSSPDYTTCVKRYGLHEAAIKY